LIEARSSLALQPAGAGSYRWLVASRSSQNTTTRAVPPQTAACWDDPQASVPSLFSSEVVDVGAEAGLNCCCGRFLVAVPRALPDLTRQSMHVWHLVPAPGRYLPVGVDCHLCTRTHVQAENSSIVSGPRTKVTGQRFCGWFGVTCSSRHHLAFPLHLQKHFVICVSVILDCGLLCRHWDYSCLSMLCC
jgi:hypothetical protein